MKLPIATLVLAALLVHAVPARAQSRVAQDAEKLEQRIAQFLVQEEVEDELRSLESQLQRLQTGMSVLEELGEREALAHVERVALKLRARMKGWRIDRLRLENTQAQSAAQAQSNAQAERAGKHKEIETAKARLKVMRTAVDAYVAIGNHEAAHLVELAMHARELAIAGEHAQAIRASAPDRAKLSGLLGYAAKLLDNQGEPERARALAELSQIFADQAARVAQLEASDASDEMDLENIEVRIKILGLAQAAFRDQGNEAATKQLAAALQYGKQYLANAEHEQLIEAAQAVPEMPALVELCRGASGLYRERGEVKKARACAALAQHYARENGLEEVGREVETNDVDITDQHEHDLSELATRAKIIHMAWAAQAEAGNERNAGMLKRFETIARLQLAEADGEAISAALVGDPPLSMGALMELIAHSSRLHADQGRADRAHLCAALAQFYADRESGAGEGSEEEPEVEEEPAVSEPGAPARDLDELATRVEILQLGAGTLRRVSGRDAGKGEPARVLAQAAQLGRLLLDGADEQAIEAGIQQLASRPQLAEALEVAANILREWNQPERADACRDLARFYLGESGEGEDHDEDESWGADSFAPDQGQGDIGDLAYRIEILRMARAAWAETDHADVREQLEQFLELAELQLSGADGGSFAGLTMGLVIEHLQGASRLYRQWGLADRATSCNDLAEFYATRERERAAQLEAPQVWDAPPHAPPDTPNLTERAKRVDILRMARDAHRYAGDAAATEMLERMVEIGEIQLEGGSDEEIGEIAQREPAISMGAVINLVARASGLLAQSGQDEQAARCAALANFYLTRDVEAEQEPAAEPGTDSRPLEQPDTQKRDRLLAQITELEAQMAALRAEIEALRKRSRR